MQEMIYAAIHIQEIHMTGGEGQKANYIKKNGISNMIITDNSKIPVQVQYSRFLFIDLGFLIMAPNVWTDKYHIKGHWGYTTSTLDCNTSLKSTRKRKYSDSDTPESPSQPYTTPKSSASGSAPTSSYYPSLKVQKLQDPPSSSSIQHPTFTPSANQFVQTDLGLDGFKEHEELRTIDSELSHHWILHTNCYRIEIEKLCAGPYRKVLRSNEGAAVGKMQMGEGTSYGGHRPSQQEYTRYSLYLDESLFERTELVPGAPKLYMSRSRKKSLKGKSSLWWIVSSFRETKSPDTKEIPSSLGVCEAPEGRLARLQASISFVEREDTQFLLSSPEALQAWVEVEQ
ncbi:hypothetical protein LOD99_10368 [Oopsacas minuta]|uniref:PH domain-containing protein n=1 Tax=Oopsacas minuta TaxID=111878 RepID=A0AAV7KGU0_9METZ|nr:hypothetical protein LOD99_10368 [Oopsacas minuta]